MKKQYNLPLISVITPTLNSEQDLPKFMESIKRQKYPNDKIEIIISDGGSTDSTIKIAKQNHAKIIKNKYVFAEPGIYLGMQKAKGELLMVLAPDNIYEDKHAFRKIADVFSNNEIYAAFPKHDSLLSDTLFTKYMNTFTDPINHFVYSAAANARTFKKVYKTVSAHKAYDVYDFNSSKILPILALAQGFTIRRNFRTIRKNIYDDITPIRDIFINRKIAYAHSLSLYHHTIRSMDHYLRKQRWLTRIALEDKRFGITARSKYFTSFQWFKFYLFPLYAFSIIFPMIRSIIGYLRDRELIWFFEPIIAFLTASAVSYELLKMRLGIGKIPSRL